MVNIDPQPSLLHLLCLVSLILANLTWLYRLIFGVPLHHRHSHNVRLRFCFPQRLVVTYRLSPKPWCHPCWYWLAHRNSSGLYHLRGARQNTLIHWCSNQYMGHISMQLISGSVESVHSLGSISAICLCSRVPFLVSRWVIFGPSNMLVKFLPSGTSETNRLCKSASMYGDPASEIPAADGLNQNHWS